MYIKVIACILMIFFATYLSGITTLKLFKGRYENFYDTYIYGFYAEFLTFNLIAIPLKTMRCSFSMLCIFYSIFIVIYTFLGFIKNKSMYNAIRNELFGIIRNISYKHVMLVLIIALHIVNMLSYAGNEADDQYYTGITWRAINHNEMISTVDIESGREVPGNLVIDEKRFCANYPLWIAFLSKVFSIHPTIVSHTICSLFFTLFAYIIYWKIGKELFDNSNKIITYMVFVWAMYFFGCKLEHSAAFKLMLCPWLGKTVASLLLILVFYYSAIMIENKEKNKYVQLSLCMWTIVFFSSMALVLGAIIIIGASVCSIIKNKSFKNVMTYVIPCIPLVFIFIISKLITLIL